MAVPATEWQHQDVGHRSAESTSYGAQEPKEPAATNKAHGGAEGSGAAWAQSPAATSIGFKPALESGGQSSQQVLERPAREVAAAAASTSTSHFAMTLPSNVIADSSAWVRDAAGAQGTPSTATGIVGDSAGASTAAAKETFAALDAGTAIGAPGWVHAGGQHAEAGFEDPALGWVSVRADLNGGSVHAAVVPGSAEAAQALSGHLAGLSAYLTEQQTPVASLTMAAPEASGMNTGVDQSMQQGANQHAGQDTAAAAQPSAQSDPSTSAPAPERSVTAESAEFGAMPYTGGRRGMHILLISA
jgi:hypothetical protein